MVATDLLTTIPLIIHMVAYGLIVTSLSICYANTRAAVSCFITILIAHFNVDEAEIKVNDGDDAHGSVSYV